MSKESPPPSDASPHEPSAASGPRLNLAPAVLGWAVPGLGHLVMGQTARGLILAVTILSLWLGGLLIGGISVIDRKDHPAWFLGQMWVAPSWLVNHYHDGLRQRWQRDAGTRADIERGYEPAYGKPEEQGILFTALAGLLNVLAIIDVIYREPWPVRELTGEDVPVMPPVPEEHDDVGPPRPHPTVNPDAAGGSS